MLKTYDQNCTNSRACHFDQMGEISKHQTLLHKFSDFTFNLSLTYRQGEQFDHSCGHSSACHNSRCRSSSSKHNCS